ncbi:MAG TPA: alpha-E domain-containing protein [Candidatus Acidoferrales bacterium]|nr:alpha-E domain-containing protein [Candidatus Acidoferrales bacterium]
MNGHTRPLLSRVADAAYWMARYIERAENVARFIDVNLHLQMDLPGERANQWQPLIDASGDTADFEQRYGEATQRSVIKFMALDPANLNSMGSCLRAARENARSIRETISSAMWEQINRIYLDVQRTDVALPVPQWLPELLHEIRLGCHLFQGIADSTMSHNEAWHFVQLGRRLERADKISRILDVKYFMLLPSVNFVGTPYDDLHWSAVLKSVSGFEMYRKKYGRISPGNIVEFLVLDRDFPRAIRHCIRGADESLHSITETPIGTYRCPSEQLLGMLRAELDFTAVESVLGSGLHEYLDGLQVKMNAIGETLSGEFFAWRRQTRATAAVGES